MLDQVIINRYIQVSADHTRLTLAGDTGDNGGMNEKEGDRANRKDILVSCPATTEAAL